MSFCTLRKLLLNVFCRMMFSFVTNNNMVIVMFSEVENDMRGIISSALNGNANAQKSCFGRGKLSNEQSTYVLAKVVQ